MPGVRLSYPFSSLCHAEGFGTCAIRCHEPPDQGGPGLLYTDMHETLNARYSSRTGETRSRGLSSPLQSDRFLSNRTFGPLAVLANASTHIHGYHLIFGFLTVFQLCQTVKGLVAACERAKWTMFVCGLGRSPLRSHAMPGLPLPLSGKHGTPEDNAGVCPETRNLLISSLHLRTIGPFIQRSST